MARRPRLTHASRRGQTLVEFALVAPLFVMVLAGIVILGIGIFYQQQVTNAAREGARYAAIHSATAQCPTVSTLDPADGAQAINKPQSYYDCDRPSDGWPLMSGHGRSKLFGLDPTAVLFTACWSGWRENDGAPDPPYGAFDTPPKGAYEITPGASPLITVDSTFVQCQINGQDATVDDSGIPCQSGLGTTDQASNMSQKQGVIVANRVTVYACFVWSPPLAGFLLIPSQVTLRAVVTEPIERQQ